jgi:hypothetical protein
LPALVGLLSDFLFGHDHSHVRLRTGFVARIVASQHFSVCSVQFSVVGKAGSIQFSVVDKA